MTQPVQTGLVIAMTNAFAGATPKEVRNRAAALSKQCSDLRVSHYGVMDIANEVLIKNRATAPVMARLEQVAGLLDSIAAAERRLPPTKKQSADEMKRISLKAYVNLDSWITYTLRYIQVLHNTIAEAEPTAPSRWKAGVKPRGTPRTSGPLSEV